MFCFSRGQDLITLKLLPVRQLCQFIQYCLQSLQSPLMIIRSGCFDPALHVVTISRADLIDFVPNLSDAILYGVLHKVRLSNRICRLILSSPAHLPSAPAGSSYRTEFVLGNLGGQGQCPAQVENDWEISPNQIPKFPAQEMFGLECSMRTYQNMGHQWDSSRRLQPREKSD